MGTGIVVDLGEEVGRDSKKEQRALLWPWGYDESDF